MAPEVLSKGRIKILTGTGNPVLRVGRLDSIRPAAPGNLPAATATVDEFVDFFAARGITAAEATALMGSHALIDTQVSERATGRRALQGACLRKMRHGVPKPAR